MNIQYSEQLHLDSATKGLMAQRLDAKGFAERRFQMNAKRLDSVIPGAGLHLAREVEFAYQEVLRTKYAPLSALSLFPTDGRVPPGALTYKMKRLSHTGDARYHRGNNADMPRSGVSSEEQIRPVRHIVTSVALDFFEEQTSQFAGTNLRGELRDAAARSVQEFLNTKTWFGDNDLDVYGVLNYPYVPRADSTISISSATADPMDILEELNRLAALASEVSSGVFMPNTMVMPIRQHNYISQTRLSSSDLSKTIKQAFLEQQLFITDIKTAPELSGAGDGGEDVLVLYRANDQNSIANVIPQGFTMLPVQQDGFNLSIPCYMSHGGVRMVEPLSNLIVTTPAVS